VQVQARVQSRAVIEITFPGVSEPGMFGRISRHALADWHAFALFSEERKAVSHMMVISGLGDFTNVSDYPQCTRRKIDLPRGKAICFTGGPDVSLRRELSAYAEF
jgi:hypothetical protein